MAACTFQVRMIEWKIVVGVFQGLRGIAQPEPKGGQEADDSQCGENAKRCDGAVPGHEPPRKRMGKQPAGLNASRVGVLGFSAGCHLAAWLSAAPTFDAYESVDETDTASARPDFLALGYPVISMEEGITHPQSREELLGTTPDDATLDAHSIDKLVTAEMPPTFIFGANDDDAVISENTFRLVAALREASVPVELHQFEQGGHGFSLRMVRDMPAEAWPDLLVEWLGPKGMLD